MGVMSITFRYDLPIEAERVPLFPADRFGCLSYSSKSFCASSEVAKTSRRYPKCRCQSPTSVPASSNLKLFPSIFGSSGSYPPARISFLACSATSAAVKLNRSLPGEYELFVEYGPYLRTLWRENTSSRLTFRSGHGKVTAPYF
jgi:hypothetical protein